MLFPFTTSRTLSWQLLRLRKLLAISAVLFFSILLPVAGHCQAATNEREITSPVVDVGLEMAQAVSKVGQRLHLSILADGEPKSMTGKAALEGPEKETLDALAEKFDYNWVKGEDGIVRLTKRFQNSETLPQFQQSELLQMADRAMMALALMPNVGGLHDHHILFNRFYATLTPENIQTLLAGKILRGDELSADQIAPLSDYVFNGTFVPTYTAWEQLDGEYTGFRGSCLRLNKLTYGGSTHDLLEWLYFDSHRVEHTRRIMVRVSGKRIEDNGAQEKSGPEQSVNAIAPKILSEEEARKALETPVHVLDGIMTVNEALSALSSQSGVVIRADSPLNSRALIVHLEGVSTVAVLKTLCAAEEWSWNIDSRGGVRIIRPFKRPVNVEEAVQALRATIPADMRWYMFGVPNNTGPRADAARDFVLGITGRFNRDAKVQKQIETDAADLQASVLKRLQNGHELPVASLSPLEQKTLLRWITLSELNEANRASIAKGVYGDYQLDPRRSEIQLKEGNYLIIGSTQPRNGTPIFIGGGEPIDSPPKPK